MPTVAQRAEALPAGFSDQIVLRGLEQPTVAKFAADGRIFVGEKSGLIKVFSGLNDATPEVFADLRTQVHNFWDRGLLGLELHPDFPRNPSVYALYTHDAAIGATAPRWGARGATSDGCPSPPGPTADGCLASGRLSLLTANGNRAAGERVLLEDWCIQYPTHTIGSMRFGADKALYVTGGEGAGFRKADYGQDGAPLNPCGDPPVPVGGAQRVPTAQGGALRSQDLRTAGDKVGLGGTLLRIDPMTGAGLPGNPFYGSADLNARRVVAYGLRNPTRFAIRPGTNEAWIGDVGWNTYEEINRVVNPADATAENFGWPCYEGVSRNPGYDVLNLDVCERLYAAGARAVVAPVFSYRHDSNVAAGEPCKIGGSSITGVEFYAGGAYPEAYDGAMFFSDYSRGCIWSMQRGTNGLPNPATLEPFVAGAVPVNLQIGPGGDLYYVDIAGGTLRRVTYTAGNTAPIARAAATPSEGAAPLAVDLDARASTDADVNDRLTYAWDLDADGAFDDANTPTVARSYTQGGTYTPSVKVTDTYGASDVAQVRVDVDNGSPAATITAPEAATTWRVGDAIQFSGQAVDPQEGPLPPAALSWSLVMHHCRTPDACHAHPMQELAGVAAGSFVAPDHEYPSWIEVRLTARDSTGLTSTRSVRLEPQTVDVQLSSDPPGLNVVLNSEEIKTPATRKVIAGSRNAVGAATQLQSGTRYEFTAWSDGGERTHTFTADQPVTLHATFKPVEPSDTTARPAVFNAGTWGLRSTLTSGAAEQTVRLGLKGDLPVTGDWEGDGTGDLGVFRAGTFHLRNGATGRVTTVAFGRAGDMPVAGDWDGDGADEVGVYRAGQWLLRGRTGAVSQFAYGRPGELALVGDWNGDGVDDPAVVAGNRWYLNLGRDNRHEIAFAYGLTTEARIVGDWDSDGVDEPAVINGNRWYLNHSFDNRHEAVVLFGQASDLKRAW